MKTSVFLSLAILLAACAPRVSVAPRDTVQVQTTTQGGNPIVVRDNNRRLTVACDGGGVTVSGNSNTLTLTGNCTVLTVTGNNNTVQVSTVREVAVRGNNNRVTWGGASSPTVNNSGNNNSFARER